MSQLLTKIAHEESTYVVVVSFVDEDAVAVIPTGITWTLTDGAGTIINDRESVAVVVPAATISIVLSGDDLVIEGTSDLYRKVTIEAVYDSTLGINLPMKSAVRFLIEELDAVPHIVVP